MKNLRHKNSNVTFYGINQLATYLLTCLVAIKWHLYDEKQTFADKQGLVLKKKKTDQIQFV